MERKRWDVDERFTGIASGRALAGPVERLAEHLQRDGWVTEDPDTHLLPHLQHWCERPGSEWRLLGARLLDDGVYEVELEPADGKLAPGLLVRDVIPLLAQVAEASFAVRQTGEDVIECVTGMLDDDGPYAAHGHVIRVRVCRRSGHGLAPEASEASSA